MDLIDLSLYFDSLCGLINDTRAHEKLQCLCRKLVKQRQSEGRILIFGNGASSSIAGHAALDFTKQGGIEALCFHDPALLTALSNDCGFEDSYAKCIEYYHRPSDICIFISVSGESLNVVNAAKRAKALGLFTVGFSGRHPDNALAKASDMSFHVDSHAYNMVENTHSSWLLCLVDLMVGSAQYEVK